MTPSRSEYLWRTVPRELQQRWLIMQDEDRYRHQAAYCRGQAKITIGTQAAQWLKLAAEYDKLSQAVVGPRSAAEPRPVMQQQQQQPQPRPKSSDPE